MRRSSIVVRATNALCALFAAGTACAQACSDADALTLRASVQADQVIRSNAPRELFGFNVPWRDFQIGFFKGDGVRPELVELLKPFKGAAYRYPGGTPSNWFEWRRATGPRDQRMALHADFDRYAKADFGPDEFATFVRSVGGRAILTLNLTGPYKKVLPPEQLKQEARDFADLVKSTAGFGCGGGKACPVMALELGNEVDWSPFNLSAVDYAERAEAVRSAVDDVLPDAVWVANGRTAPWDSKKGDFKAYNKGVARALAAHVQGIAIHPYYDGIAVPSALDYVRSFADTWKAERSDASVYVTEHARWPAQPARGKWEENWYQGTGLGGAVSSADFLLGLMPMPAVAAANWHALGTQGPWQLVRWDKASEKMIPSPVYWGMRVLRDAYLDHVVKVDYKPTRESGYGGGYDQRLVAMRAAAQNGPVSVLGVNRGSRPMTLELDWGAAPRHAGRAQLRFISGDSERADNDIAQPRRVQMATQAAALPARTHSTWCVPPRAVFSVSEP